MKTTALVAVLAAVIAVGQLSLTAAETARFRHVVSVYVDEKGNGINHPEGIACDGKAQFVVGDTGNDRVLRFMYQDGKVTGGREIKIPELSAPSRIQLGPNGEIYALDAKRRRIVRLDENGAFKGPLSFDGAPPPATVMPKSFTVDSAGNFYVLDVFGARVLVLTTDGRFQRAIPLPDDTGFISDVAVDAAGNVLVIDAVRRRMLSAGKDASTFAPLGGDLTNWLLTLPTSITTTRGAIFIAEGRGGGIVTFGTDGSFLSRQLAPGWRDGSLNHPAQVCANAKDLLFVADRDNSRVQVFGLIR